MMDDTDRDEATSLDKAIEELGPVDPPQGFSRQVMAKISLEAARPRPGVTRGNKGEMVMMRKAMWGLAAAAAVVLVVYSVVGFPSIGRGTEGTIGAAQKAVTPQLTNKDVVLGDATAQEFLQSDVFDKIAKDPDARALFSNAAVRNMLDSADARASLKNSDVRNVLTRADVRNIFDNAEARAELGAQLKNRVAADVVNRAVAADARAQARAAVARILSDANVRNALENASVRNM